MLSQNAFMTDKPEKKRKNAVPDELSGDILYYAHIEGLTDKRIGEIVGKDHTTVGKIRKKAEKKYLVKILDIPRNKTLEKELKQRLQIDDAVLVSRGHDKNSDNLGFAAAKYLCSLFVEAFQDRDTINISVSCGSTIRATCQHLAERLYNDNISLRDKTLHIYPSALIGGNHFAKISPSFAASLLASKLLALPEELRPHVRCFRSIIPALYYSEKMSDAERATIKKYYGYDTILADPVQTLDILVTGIGRVVDDEYLLACELTGIPLDVDAEQYRDTPEVNFTPIDKNGVIEKYYGLIEGAGIEQMRAMKQSPGKYVIALIGGRDKAGIAATVFHNPYFNVLFTDNHVIDAWLKQEQHEITEE